MKSTPIKFLLWWVFFICMVFVAQTLHAEKVTRVIDGDTFYIGQKAFRLYGIDAYELAQVGGKQAREMLESLVLGKDVKYIIKKSTHKKRTKNGWTTITSEIDPFGRTVVVAVVGTEIINSKMVESGWAVAYTDMCLSNECDTYATLEKKAHEAKVGAWALYPVPMRPVDFRDKMYKYVRD